MSDPSFLLALRALVARARHGALATVSREAAGRARWPFASLVSVAFDSRARPVFLLSRLAEHTKNLEECARASLLVTEGGAIGKAEPDPMAAGRVTLLGECARVGESEAAEALATFLRAHAEAKAYSGFPDFAAWRLEVASVRWVGGFGRMEWLDADAYRLACGPGAAGALGV
ncbi:MAG: pyridoxamine 5'-phosphate oxidase family protein [Myxococcales bacterium]|nr:pyridoxamine 5'-phosphate oxidase family protein [Myxococcales bacterium]